ncbi:lipase family protein [Streptomyces atriruber]|uniref:lipase family protein n=1 Tax=Streptomyces atriruber TaxID=545121 RepID=UPI0006E37698|nr:lipase family protein [Streptomyces atriruber]
MRDDFARGPSFAELRPLKDPTEVHGPGRPGFPVHENLVDLLAAEKGPPPAEGPVPHTMATCSAYAYAGAGRVGDPGTVAMIMSRLGLEENRCRVFEQRVDAMYIASAAYLVQDKDRRVVILCYRGTQPEDIISILTDADVRPETLSVELAGTRHQVHAGFYRNMRATRHLIMQALERAARGESVDPTEKGVRGDGMEALYITGHSLGGAMAALMGVVLTHEPRYRVVAERLRAVYTFGQPLLGGPEFAAACARATDERGEHVLRDRLLRYIFDRDVVPALPPRPVGPYAPFGREFHYRRPRGVTEGALAFAAETAIDAVSLPGDLLRGQLRRNAGRRARAAGRSLTALARGPREGGWAEVHDPGLHYPQMDSLAGLAVVAPLAFFAARLALTRTIPFTYSFEDHGPGHYVNALAPPGVLSEFGDVR